MSSIKSLADELREAMRNPEPDVKKIAARERPPPVPDTQVKKAIPDKNTVKLPELTVVLADIKSHEPGTEKILIRLAPTTVKLLKKLKIVQAIEVNRFISFALHKYLETNPGLILYIKESLKNDDV